jgi:alkylation response protein AidB-like acyl-CoA dehydrogenase
MYDLAVEQTVRRGADAWLSAAVKAQAGRVLHAVAQTAIQVTGGISFTWEYSLNRPHQRGLGLDQFAGSSPDLTLALGRLLRTGSEFPRRFGL